MNDWDRRFEKKPVTWSILWLLGGTIFFLLFIWGIILANFGLRVATAGLFGAGGAHIRTQSTEFRLRAYQSFFDICRSVQTNEASIDSQRAQLAASSRPEDISRIQANLVGVETARADGINRYNAEARTWTSGQFRDNDLPARLDDKPYDGRNKTSCGWE